MRLPSRVEIARVWNDKTVSSPSRRGGLASSRYLTKFFSQQPGSAGYQVPAITESRIFPRSWMYFLN